MRGLLFALGKPLACHTQLKLFWQNYIEFLLLFRKKELNFLTSLIQKSVVTTRWRHCNQELSSILGVKQRLDKNVVMNDYSEMDLDELHQRYSGSKLFLC